MFDFSGLGASGQGLGNAVSNGGGYWMQNFTPALQNGVQNGLGNGALNAINANFSNMTGLGGSSFANNMAGLSGNSAINNAATSAATNTATNASNIGFLDKIKGFIG